MFYFIYIYRKGLSTKKKKTTQNSNSETLEPEISYAVL